ncbi:hypothetical protein BDR04DRAFT_1151455 [Suillus decipiens]|nr:hypothetical protein BDR04DRAFT_1151455 [Suillus decipiens]
MDSDEQDVSTKKSQAEAETPIASQQPTQCSGYPGAGTGGRVSQLEIIGALLGAPAHTSQPKGSTSLNSSIPINPLAPEPPCKRGQMKKPPPPYSASGKLMNSAPSRPQGEKATAAKKTTPVALTVKSMDSVPLKPWGKKATLTKKTTPIASTVKPPNLQPSFIHHEVGAHFGFSQFIIPPGTKPDLQALNNPYVAAAREKQALSTGLAAHQPDAIFLHNSVDKNGKTKTKNASHPET